MYKKAIFFLLLLQLLQSTWAAPSDSPGSGAGQDQGDADFPDMKNAERIVLSDGSYFWRSVQHNVPKPDDSVHRAMVNKQFDDMNEDAKTNHELIGASKRPAFMAATWWKHPEGHEVKGTVLPQHQGKDLGTQIFHSNIKKPGGGTSEYTKDYMEQFKKDHPEHGEHRSEGNCAETATIAYVKNPANNIPSDGIPDNARWAVRGKPRANKPHIHEPCQYNDEKLKHGWIVS
ncbi:unnamed protein product [Clonostachys byssicola]|uniref:Uncharacterized protein n=1 Tax=Clonostachys byssicola TaxID=160290 RepID=A0A9N9UQ97_9HYPO|nr:unnamed protein product [Clonostachys byssicola]